MKQIIVLSLVIASVLGNEFSFDSNEDTQQRNRYAPLNQEQRRGIDSSNLNGRVSLDQDLNGITSETLNRILSSQINQRQQGTLRSSNYNIEDHSSLGYWATYPDAAAFDAKIKARLSSSRILSSKRDVRQHLEKLAETKFNTCKEMAEDRERACLGRVVGQIMQLVAAVENMERNAQ